MTADERLLDVAAALLDGAAVDWESAARAMTNDEERRLLDELRFIAALGASPAETSRSSAVPLEVGACWGPLRIIEPVGGGTFGDVYRAWDSRLDREVALKILRHERRDDRASTVIQEGRLLARVRHPNVVTVYGAERIDGQVGMWMEFVHGQTLHDALGDEGPFDVDRVIGIGLQLSHALSTIHSAGLLHGDVKAQNVLCDAAGRLVLTDFGAGIELHESPVDGARDVAGTPLCVAPEVLAGQPASPRSDLYSLAVLLYQLLTGTYPVRGQSLKDVREAHANRTRTSLLQARPDVRRDLVHIIDRALDPDPRVRHHTLEMFHDDLKRLDTSSDAAANRATSPAPARTKRAWVAALLMVASAVSLALWRTSATATDQAQGSANSAAPPSTQNVAVIEFPGATRTELQEISDNGAIVGSYVDAQNRTHGFLLIDGKFTIIDVPGAARTRPTGLNDAGTIVGDYSDANETVHGFLFKANGFSVIDVPNATSTRAAAVNSDETIVGDYRDVRGHTHGFMLRDGAFTTIDVPGSISTRAIGLDAHGNVVGDYQDQDRLERGFLLKDNRFTTIRIPGASVTQAFGLNANGAIVGRFQVGDRTRGFLIRDDDVTTFDVPTAVRTHPMAINASGVIIGLYLGGEPLRVRGFVRTP